MTSYRSLPRQPWLSPTYEAISLPAFEKNDKRVNPGNGTVQVNFSNGSLPVYIKAGANVLRLEKREFNLHTSDRTPSLSLTSVTSPGGGTLTLSSIEAHEFDSIGTSIGRFIGRQVTPELGLDDTASRRHFGATVFAGGETVLLADLGSNNGTTVYAPAQQILDDYTIVIF